MLHINELLKVLKVAQDFIPKKSYGAEYTNAYLMCTGEKLVVRAFSRCTIFSSALDAWSPHTAWERPVIISAESLSEAIAFLRGKRGICNVVATDSGVEIEACASGTKISLPHSPNAESVLDAWQSLDIYLTPDSAFDSTIPASGVPVSAADLARIFAACAELHGHDALPMLCRQRGVGGLVFWRVSCGDTWLVTMAHRDDVDNKKAPLLKLAEMK